MTRRLPQHFTPFIPNLSCDKALAAIAAIQANVERTGRLVRRVRVPVATMIAELKRHNWPNDTQHRAMVIRELGAR